MKLFKRMLAMLAVIAITVSGFAFAEEGAPVIEIEEIAIEEAAAEESAAAEELAEEADEAIPAEAAEESAEPVEETPAEEEAAGEEMPESIDVPVVCSYYHRDEVPGNCPHTRAYVTGDARWDKQVLSQDARNHTLRYTGEEYFYCPDCGYDYYLPIDGYKETTEAHIWSGDWCWECGYISTCAHANTSLQDSYFWGETVISTDAKSHTLNAYVSRYYECPDCGYSEYEYSEEPEIFTEPHEWMDDGICWACKAENSCKHPNRRVEHENHADIKLLSTDAKSHTYSYRSEMYFSCPDCSFTGWELSDEVQTVTEPHDWYEGKCWVCEKTNSCLHLNAVADPYPGRTNMQTVGSTAREHTVSYQEIIYYECPDCFESYREVSPETITLTEPHDWYNGFCDFCETANPCAHPNLVFEHSGRISQELISYDEKGHTCVFAERSWYYCPDCEENMWEDSAESYTATEAHVWWEGKCEYCPAVNPCPHEGLYADYVSTMVRKVLSVTAAGHTIEYQEETLYICPDCGDEYWETDPEVRTKTEAHDWNEGVCWVCEAQNSCKHADKAEEGTYWNIVKVLSTTALKHTAEVRDVTYSVCNDCGERIYEEAASTYTLSAVHEWNEEGYCYECNYRNTCAHSNSIISSFYDNYGWSEAADAYYHHKNYYLIERSVCQDCGFSTQKVLSTEIRLEEHDIEANNKCRICGYKTECSHKNTDSIEQYWFDSCVSKNSKLHNLTRKLIRITSCEDCGKEISRKELGKETIEDYHYFNHANICASCDYESSCSHSRTEKQTYTNIYKELYDRSSHISQTYEYTSAFCKSCECELETLATSRVAGTKLEKHSFKNGRCTECGQREIECIHDFGKDGKCKLCGAQQNVELEAIILPRSIMLYVGEEFRLEASLSPSNASAELKYSSSNTKVASVSDDGVITPKKAGEVTITVRSGDVKASCTVTVAKRIEEISLNRSELTLRLNAGYQLSAAIEPADADRDLLWTSSSFSTVSVDQDGFITANAYGSAVITVSSNANPEIKASCTVTVSDAVPEIDPGVSELILAEKQSYQLKPVMVPESAGAEFSYASSNTKAATVTSGGRISAVKAGTATITITGDNGAEASLSVTVKKAPSKVSISDTKLTVGAGESFQLSASIAEDCHTELSWSSSNSKVATVDENGFVTTLKDGKANITVKTHNGKSAKCAVTVKKAPESIELSKSTLSLCEGESAKLSAKLSKGSESVILWSVSGDAVTVEDGAVTAVKIGSATITAATYNGLSASCTVAVRPAPTHIVLSEEKLRMSEKQSITLDAKLMAGSEAAAGKVSYSSSNTKAATVSADGVITSKKAGETTITVKAFNGVSAQCTVTVYAAPTKVSLNAKSATIGVGETFELIPGYSSGEALTSFSYTSSNSKVASIEQIGDNCIVTALKAGKANITIKTHNGKSAKCAVTVKEAPKSIELSESALMMGVGQSSQLSVSLPRNTAAQIIWSVDGDAVTVENGAVTAVKAGSATITAATMNGLVSASCSVTVKPAPEKLLVEDAVIVVGQKLSLDVKLQAGGESYEGAYSVKLSSGSSVLSMDKKTGAFTAKKAGTAFVTVTAYNGVSAECTVTVYAAPKSVKLSASKKTLEVGESFELTAKPNPIDAYTDGFTVSMDEEGVVSVDGEDGVFTVTAEAKGRVKITIAASNGKKASCTVTVK